jgi:hypothetical protein
VAIILELLSGELAIGNRERAGDDGWSVSPVGVGVDAGASPVRAAFTQPFCAAVLPLRTFSPVRWGRESSSGVA